MNSGYRRKGTEALARRSPKDEGGFSLRFPAGPLFLLLLLLAFPALAEEIPLKIKADQLYYEANAVHAAGSVEVILGSLEVRADRFLLDTDANLATAEGAVKISSAGYTAEADQLTFTITTEVARIKNFRAVVAPAEIRGKLYLRAEEFWDRPGRQDGFEGRLTTCDYLEPHYRLKAREVEYYPDDKVVGKSITFYVGDKPLFFAPYYIYSIGKRKSQPMLPIFGSNAVEGAFLKTTFDYFLNRGSWGSLYLDLMGKKGVGKGIGHNFEIGSAGKGNLYLYNLGEADTGKEDWVIKLDHELNLGQETVLRSKYNYANIYILPSGRVDQVSGGLSFQHKSAARNFSSALDYREDHLTQVDGLGFRTGYQSGGTDTNYSFFQQSARSGSRWKRIEQQFNLGQSLLPGLTGSVSGRYYSNQLTEVATPDERLDPAVALTYRTPLYSLGINANWYYDLDGERYTADDYDEYIERYPEATLTVNPLNLGLFSLSPDLAVARYHERKYLYNLKRARDFIATRYKLGLGIGREILFPFASRLILSGRWDQFYYEPGDALYTLQEGTQFITETGGFLTNQVNYQRGYSAGNTPFYFDAKGIEFETLKNTLTFYQGDRFRLSIDGGYNFQIRKYFDVITVLQSRPSPSLQLRAESGYDIENRRWRDLAAGLLLFPLAGMRNELNTTYSLSRGELLAANSVVDYELGTEEAWQSHWRFAVNHSYDIVRREYLLRELTVVKDLHCWEARFNYSEFRRDWRLTFVLKAYPEAPAVFSSGGKAFYLEGLEKESPARY